MLLWKTTQYNENIPMKQIIMQRSLKLGDSSPEIKREIGADANKRYTGLKVKKNELVYCTEGIYPDHSKHCHRIPVLFLFSNPHPESVEKGLFLSEPHSRTFWQRLFESDFIRLPSSQQIYLEHWDKSTPDLIKELMIEGKYDSPFLLYFHCLYSIPTRQLADLRRLFKGEPQLWAEVKESSRKELCMLVEDEQIQHIVVFSVKVFREITGAGGDTCKKWLDKVKCAIDDNKHDVNKYWEILSAGDAKTKLGSCDAKIYLGLNTRVKNIGKGMKKRYFTLALDMILARIRQQAKSTCGWGKVY